MEQTKGHRLMDRGRDDIKLKITTYWWPCTERLMAFAKGYLKRDGWEVCKPMTGIYKKEEKI
jgi:hypothetical protein